MRDNKGALFTHPSAAESVEITAADAAVCDLDVDVCLLPRFGLELAPNHLSVDRIGIVAQPALEFVVGARHVCDVCQFRFCLECEDAEISRVRRPEGDNTGYLQMQ